MKKIPSPTVVVPSDIAGIFLLLRALFRPSCRKSIRHAGSCAGQACAGAASLQKNRRSVQEPASTMVSYLRRVAGRWKVSRNCEVAVGAQKGHCRLQLQGGESESDACGRGDVVLEKRKEINLWKRRAVKPPMSLRV